jgi:hypothetical protein
MKESICSSCGKSSMKTPSAEEKICGFRETYWMSS